MNLEYLVMLATAQQNRNRKGMRARSQPWPSATAWSACNDELVATCAAFCCSTHLASEPGARLMLSFRASTCPQGEAAYAFGFVDDYVYVYVLYIQMYKYMCVIQVYISIHECMWSVT